MRLTVTGADVPPGGVNTGVATVPVGCSSVTVAFVFTSVTVVLNPFKLMRLEIS